MNATIQHGDREQFFLSPQDFAIHYFNSQPDFEADYDAFLNDSCDEEERRETAQVEEGYGS